MIPIDERTALPVEAFRREYERTNRPVVIRGAVWHWKAIGDWSPESLAERFGNREVTIRHRQMTFGEFYRALVDAPDDQAAPYLRNQIIEDFAPELLKEMTPFHPYAQCNWRDSRLVPNRIAWPIHGKPDMHIGRAGGRFGLHRDELGSHAYVNQIYGLKEVVFATPGQTDRIYLDPNEPLSDISLVDNLDAPDLKKFPRFADVELQRILIEPGDLVFIPMGWWHATRIVEGLSITLGLNIVNGSNWSQFADEVYAFRRAKHPVAAKAIHAYLKAFGYGRAALERRGADRWMRSTRQQWDAART